ncbi:MAG: rhodanese-like domain-containing protein [Saprospiraceae bacterium]|nr:rhodanese-like domain-containing protein [Saprospiraceae bacterium]
MLLVVLVLCAVACTSTSPKKEETPERAVFETVSLASFKMMMEEEPLVLIDVRTPEEAADGMIAGAELIDFRSPDFQVQIERLDRDASYGIYCRSGGRSNKAMTLMRELGFRSVVELEGGYSNWIKESEK